MNVYEAMGRILQYASDYLDIVPDTAANNADVTQVRQMLDAYDALTPDWANAPDEAKWYFIEGGIGKWSDGEPVPFTSGWGHRNITRTWFAGSVEIPPGIDPRLCRWSREGAK